MELIYAILLAIIQGIAEWLPISSSAHLALAQMALGLTPPIFFDILLHVGSLVAVALFMRNEIFAMLKSLMRPDWKDENFRLAIFVVVASIPTAIIGFAFKKFFESMFSSSVEIGIALLITAFFLYVCEMRKTTNPLSAPVAFVIGIAQGIAVAPGISRSGSTIGAAMLLGVEREKAARFSFLLSIPAVFGAALFEAKDVLAQGFVGLDFGMVILAPIVSALVGYFTIGLLLKFLKEKGLRPFAYYCLALGILAILFGFRT